MQHCFNLAVAFQMIDIGPNKKSVDGNRKKKYRGIANSSSPTAAGKRRNRAKLVSVFTSPITPAKSAIF